MLGNSVCERLSDDLAESAFLNAWQLASAPHGVLFHSNRRSQYRGSDVHRTLTAQGFVSSMSRKACGWVSVVAELPFGTLKNEEATGFYPTKAATHVGFAKYISGFCVPTLRYPALGNHSPDNWARMLNAA